MPIPEFHSANFSSMIEAAFDGNLALMEGNEAVTGKPAYIICMASTTGKTRGSQEEVTFTPVGQLYHTIDPDKFDPFTGYIPLGWVGRNGETAETVQAQFRKDAHAVLAMASKGCDGSEEQTSALSRITDYLFDQGARPSLADIN